MRSGEELKFLGYQQMHNNTDMGMVVVGTGKERRAASTTQRVSHQHTTSVNLFVLLNKLLCSDSHSILMSINSDSVLSQFLRRRCSCTCVCVARIIAYRPRLLSGDSRRPNEMRKETTDRSTTSPEPSQVRQDGSYCWGDLT